jgi:CBS domain-containing protein
MKTGQIITPHPKCVSPEATVQEAAQEMKILDVGILPVCENERLVGAVTDRDITIRAVARGCDPRNTPIKDVMTEESVYCFDDQDIEEAARMMEEQRVRRLPVLNRDKRLIVIISIGDLAVRGGKEEMAGEVLGSVSARADIR